jgi:hypothetical protein
MKAVMILLPPYCLAIQLAGPLSPMRAPALGRLSISPIRARYVSRRAVPPIHNACLVWLFRSILLNDGDHSWLETV